MTNPSGFDLLREAARIVALLEDAEGELTPEALEAIDAWTGAVDEKLPRYRAVAVAMKYAIEMHAAEVKRHQARIKALKATVERITDLATQVLKAREDVGEEARVRIGGVLYYLQKTERVVGPKRGEDWPVEYQRPKVEPDKAKAKRALKAGLKIEGVTLEKGRGIRWK